jgi:hypothetical protein
MNLEHVFNDWEPTKSSDAKKWTFEAANYTLLASLRMETSVTLAPMLFPGEYGKEAFTFGA